MLKGRYIVLIEDDTLMGSSLVQRLELEGATVTWLRQVVRGIAAVRTPRRPVDAVICDIRLPDGTGEDIFSAVSRSMAPPPFLFITGQGEIDQAVRLLRAGAADYLTKPFDLPTFLQRLSLVMRPDVANDMPPQAGISLLARQVDSLVLAAARHDMPVLIRGQRGLGKARLARRIHELSDRRLAPLVAIDVFRDESGERAIAAALDAASEGTLFVNGIGRLDPAAQRRLMAAIGQVDVRVIGTCGTRIDEKIATGRFRSDLHCALVANEIVVPPLSQRIEDAVWLAGQMFQAFGPRRPTRLKGLSELALAAIRDHDWPGNGREVRSRLLRAIDAARGEWIYPADLFPEFNLDDREVLTLADARERAERRQILKVLAQTGGQIGEAARLLKVSRTTLWEKMQKLGI